MKDPNTAAKNQTMSVPSDPPGTTNHSSLPSFDLETPVNESPLHGLWALTNRDLKKWYKAPLILLLTLIQPVIWLGLFGDRKSVV